VEAIRHLEGDHLFSDDPSPRCGQQQQQQQHLSSSVMDEPAQEVPLALTMHNKPITQPTQMQVAHRLLKVEMNPFLQFHSSPQSTQQRTALQQQRPGVIVVKQHT
jgi:GTP1/Obg family GTP-binding protein